MAMKKCPVCGEKYSDTYRSCPFCEEEKNFRRGKSPKRKGGHRVSQGGPSLLSPMLVIAIVLMAALLIYLLFGKAIGEKLGWGQNPAGSENPGIVSSEGGSSSGAASSGASSGGASSSGEEPVVDPEPAGLTYEAAFALPDGLTLSKTDYSTNVGDPDVTLSVSGGSGSYTWLSEDDGVASVDQNGKVTAISRGTINVLVTDGSKKAVCIVRCSFSGTLTTTPGTGTGTGTAASGTLHTGSAVVINGGNGVNVRSDPSTDHAPLATVPNGASVQIIGSAGDGWYKITFSGVGGVETAGYMKGDFLKND